MLCACVIIHGSSDKHHQAIRLELQKDFAKGHHNYPNTASEAQSLLIQYCVKNNSNQNKQHNNNNKNRGQKDGSNDNKDGKQSNDAGTSKSSGVSTEKAHNMLMHCLDEDDSDDGFMFFNLGVETFLCDSADAYDAFESNTLKDSSDEESWMSTDSEDTVATVDTLESYNDKTLKESFELETTKLEEQMANEKTPQSVQIDNAFLFAQQNGGDVNPKWLLLDSQSSCNIICNPDLVNNIHKHPAGGTVWIHCNARTKIVDTVADLPGLGMVWSDESCIANCLSLARVSDHFRVTLDTAVSQGIFVHRSNGTARRFDRTECNLYACDLSQEEEFMLVTTVSGQKEYYSDLDIRRAEKAQKLQETMGFPSLKAFLHMVDNNMIKNCPITRRDVMMAEDIFGVNVNIVKGKSVRRQPVHIREDILPVPPEILQRYGEVTLSIDVYHINGVRFFRSIARHLMFRITQPIADAKASTLLKQVQRTMSKYASRGFKVKQIFGDNAFNCIADDLAESGVTFHSVARDAHEPYIERDNRVSKERCRCIFNALPFTKMPLRMIMELPVAVDYWLNYWCSSGGVSRTMPPRQLITGIALDAAKHCRFQYGDYVLAHNETDNTMKPRAADAIYLRPTGTPDGAFFVFDLKTARRVRKHSATPAHMTDSVIKRVHEIAESQDVPIGLTFGDTENNVTILDLDTQSIATKDDDDNASDASFVPEDQSVETELTGVVDEQEDEESVRSGRGYDGDHDEEGEDEGRDNNYHGQADNIDTTNNGGNEDGVQVDESHDEITETNANKDENIPDDAKEEITIEFHNDDGNTDDGVNIVHPTIKAPERRTGLRESVKRTHPKFSTNDGFNETVRHRNLFCRGYEAAVQSIASRGPCKNHVGIACRGKLQQSGCVIGYSTIRSEERIGAIRRDRRRGHPERAETAARPISCYPSPSKRHDERGSQEGSTILDVPEAEAMRQDQRTWLRGRTFTKGFHFQRRSFITDSISIRNHVNMSCGRH